VTVVGNDVMLPWDMWVWIEKTFIGNSEASGGGGYLDTDWGVGFEVRRYAIADRLWWE